jgi:hypothetical protein
MRIRAAEGYIVIVSIPAALMALAEIDCQHEALRGRGVALTATLKSFEDPTVAFGSRPAKARLA